jgi:hypothetical protein
MAHAPPGPDQAGDEGWPEPEPEPELDRGSEVRGASPTNLDVDPSTPTPMAAPGGRRGTASLWVWPAVGVSAVALAGQILGVLAAEVVGALLAGIAVAHVSNIVNERKWSSSRSAAMGMGASLVVLALAALQSGQFIGTDEPRDDTASLAGGALDLRGRKVTQELIKDANLRGAQLQGADLSSIDLHASHLEGANLAGANLRKANLLGAFLQGANLSGADMREACLKQATFSGADLRDVDATGADTTSSTVSVAATLAARVWSKQPNTLACP